MYRLEGATPHAWPTSVAKGAMSGASARGYNLNDAALVDEWPHRFRISTFGSRMRRARLSQILDLPRYAALTLEVTANLQGEDPRRGRKYE